jgi:hypothetical protein
MVMACAGVSDNQGDEASRETERPSPLKVEIEIGYAITLKAKHESLTEESTHAHIPR